MLVDGAQWFTINYQYASQIMLDVFKKNREYTLKAKKQAMHNRGHFVLSSILNLL